VVVTHGAQQALDLIGRVLVDPGTCVAVEEPGYQPARLVFRALGARVVGVPVDDEGLSVAELPAEARLVYVTPSHQFPLGTPMSLARRGALLAWAGRHGAVVVEDDYDSEYRFSDRPLEPLQSLDRDGRVVYVGSFSKTLAPMLRLGFVVAPATLQPALRAAKRLADWHGELPSQAALARFIDEGQLARHVRRANRVYADRRDRVLAGLDKHLAGRVVPVPAAAGLHLCAVVPPDARVDMDLAVDRAHAAGVGFQPLSDFCGDEPRPGVVLGYGAIPTDRIDAGIAALASCFT
jgi:GntR family transcriptional regulator/MocR family aminotransferase